MNIIDLSNIEDPDNDYFRLFVAMDADSISTINIYESGGSGIISYQTSSDYVYSIKRFAYGGSDLKELEVSDSSRIGYPSGISWIPGDEISSMSNNALIDESNEISGILNGYVRAGQANQIKPLTPKVSLSDSSYLLSGKYIPSDHYEESWCPDYNIQVTNVNSLDGRMPFVQVKESDIQNTGSITIISSSQKGSIFSMDIGRDFMEVGADFITKLNNIDEIKPALNNSNQKNSMLKEWNSIFAINENCNADSIFSNKRNRDEAFAQHMQAYLDKNWYNKIKDNLWGDCIDDESLDLTTRDPELLKNIIMYQFYYFGTSDDIRIMGGKKYKSMIDFTSIRWHIGLGGIYEKSNSSRKLTQELSYLSPVSLYRNIYKVIGLPPRTTYSYNLQNNINIADFID